MPHDGANPSAPEPPRDPGAPCPYCFSRRAGNGEFCLNCGLPLSPPWPPGPGGQPPRRREGRPDYSEFGRPIVLIGNLLLWAPVACIAVFGLFALLVAIARTPAELLGEGAIFVVVIALVVLGGMSYIACVDLFRTVRGFIRARADRLQRQQRGFAVVTSPDSAQPLPVASPIEQFWAICARAEDAYNRPYAKGPVVIERFSDMILDLIDKHPGQRDDFARAFVLLYDSPEHSIWEIIACCMRTLRWAEVYIAFCSRLATAQKQQDWRSIPILMNIVEASEGPHEDAPGKSGG